MGRIFDSGVGGSTDFKFWKFQEVDVKDLRSYYIDEWAVKVI
jgi:hypothetical protein